MVIKGMFTLEPPNC